MIRQNPENHGSTNEFMFYIWSIFKPVIADSALGKTKPKFWRILVWSFEAALDGKWPKTDWDGKEWSAAVDRGRAGQPLAGTPSDFYVMVL